jgi:pSer/pThr/pTyr-binding forkhead associated (FHA) protein
MDVRFVILSPSGKHRTTSRSLPLLVGRSEDAKLRISQDCVSRRHCQFLAKDGEVFVRDLDSTNGTLLDGERIEPQADTFVRPGSVVIVGGATFRVDYGIASMTVAVPSSTASEKVTVPLTGEAPAIEITAPDERPVAELDSGDDAAVTSAPESAASSFAFLGSDAEQGGGAGDDEASWPQSPDAAQPPSDGDLGDFFKSLS